MSLSRESIIKNMDEKSISPALPLHLKMWLNDFIDDDCFLEGIPNLDHQLKQFRSDYIDRTFRCNDRSFMSYFPEETKKEKITDIDIIEKLAEIYGGETNAKAILEANTQQVGMVVCNLFLAKISCSNIPHDDMGALKFIHYPNNEKIINLVYDIDKKQVKLYCTYTCIPVTNSKEKGYLPGPITAEFVLRKNEVTWGFQFEGITEVTPLIANALSGTMIHLNDIFLKCIPVQPKTPSFWNRALNRVQTTLREIAEELDEIGDSDDESLVVLEKPVADCPRTGGDSDSMSPAMKISIGAGIGAGIMAVILAAEYASSAKTEETGLRHRKR